MKSDIQDLLQAFASHHVLIPCKLPIYVENDEQHTLTGQPSDLGTAMTRLATLDDCIASIRRSVNAPRRISAPSSALESGEVRHIIVIPLSLSHRDIAAPFCS